MSLENHSVTQVGGTAVQIIGAATGGASSRVLRITAGSQPLCIGQSDVTYNDNAAIREYDSVIIDCTTAIFGIRRRDDHAADAGVQEGNF
jgi:hypothetical protein